MIRTAIALSGLALLVSCATTPPISPAALFDLAPTGKLRAGINYGNGVLATRDPATGEPRGIAVNLARELGRRIGVPVELVVYDQARLMVEGVKAGAWDVAFLAIDPLRADIIDFTAPYAEIEGTYLVPAGSPIRTIADVDRAGVRVAVTAKSNYDLFLTRNLKQAQLIRSDTTPGAADLLATGKVDVLAGVKQRIVEAAGRIPGSRQLDGRFMAIRQAVATPKSRDAGLRYLRVFVEDIKASGLVAREVEKAGVTDAAVSPPAPVQ
jgi:polar amino acid transport system substrate-binding protein